MYFYFMSTYCYLLLKYQQSNERDLLFLFDVILDEDFYHIVNDLKHLFIS